MNANGTTTITISELQLHELRNRLTVVKGTAQLLERHVQRNDEEMSQIASRTEALLLEINALEAVVMELTTLSNTAQLNRNVFDAIVADSDTR